MGIRIQMNILSTDRWCQLPKITELVKWGAEKRFKPVNFPKH